MRRSLDWKRHRLLAAAAVAVTTVLALELGRAVAAAALLALLVLWHDRLGWLGARRAAQTIRVRVPDDFEYERALGPMLRRCTCGADLTDVHSVAPGAGTELVYRVRLKPGQSVVGLRQDLEGLITGSACGEDAR